MITERVFVSIVQFSELDSSWCCAQDNSKWRGHYLTSLYEYMHGCQKELNFLAEEQEKIKKQDWSDRMVDPPDTRRQYEVRPLPRKTKLPLTTQQKYCSK